MATITGSATLVGTAGESLFLVDSGQGLTVHDILDEICLLWGYQSAYLAPTYMQKRAIHDMNGAFQMIWSLAKDVDYFSRQTLTLTFGSNVNQQTLPGEVLTILGPCRLMTGQPLRPISSRSQYDSYGELFLGQYTEAVASGTPQAFWVERLFQPEPDNVENILHIVPAPITSTNILLDISLQPPRYEWSDFVLSTPVQFPQRYADSVLVPFCRYRAMSSFVLADPDTRPTLVADYQNALRLIGAVDPEMKSVEFAERATDKAA